MGFDSNGKGSKKFQQLGDYVVILRVKRPSWGKETGVHKKHIKLPTL